MAGVTLYDKDNKPVTVPTAEAPAKVLSGEYGYTDQTTVPVMVDGQMMDVPAAGLKSLAGKSGVSTVTDQEVQKYDAEKKYGGMGHGAAAAALGFADTATFGIAPTIAGAVSDDFREYQRDVELAHPTATTVGQVGGIVAPIAADILSGGAATPLVAGSLARVGARGAEAAVTAERALTAARALEGVEAARGIESAASVAARPNFLGRAAEALAAPQRALGTVGNVGERAVNAILGKEAESLAGQILQRSAALGVRGAMEGGVVGGLEGLKEEVLKDSPGVSGGKVLASALHGMGYGALFGGGLGGASAVGTRILSRAAPLITEGADQVAARALFKDAGMAAKAADELGQGGLRRAVGNAVKEGVIAAGDTAEQVADKVAARRIQAEREAQAALADLDQWGLKGEKTGRNIRTGPAAEDLVKAIDEVYPGANPSSKLGEPVPPGLGKIRDDLSRLREAVEPPVAEAVVRPARPMTDAEIQDLVRADPKDPRFQAWAEANFSEKARPVHPPEVVQPAPALGKEVPNPGDGRLTFQEAAGAASQVLDMAERAAGPERQKLLSLYGRLADHVEASALETAQRAGESRGTAKAIENLKRRAAGEEVPLQKDLLAREMVEQQLQVGKALQSARDWRFMDRYAEASGRSAPKVQESLFGGLPLLGAAAKGIAGGSLSAGYVAGLAGKAALEQAKLRAGSTATVAADRLASIATVERAVQKFDRDLQKGVNKIFESRVEEVGRLAEERAAAAAKKFEVEQRALATGLDRDDAAAMGAHFDTEAATQALFETNRDKLMKWVGDVAQFQRNMELWGSSLPPGAASAFEKGAIRVATYLVNALPKKGQDPSALVPASKPFTPSQGEMAAFNRKFAVVQKPLSYCELIASGKLTPDEAEAVGACHPEVKAAVDKAIDERLKQDNEAAEKAGRKKGKKAEPAYKPYLSIPAEQAVRRATGRQLTAHAVLAMESRTPGTVAPRAPSTPNVRPGSFSGGKGDSFAIRGRGSKGY